MDSKTLPAILYDEGSATQFYVSLYVIFSIASLHLMLYTFRIVLTLSAIEQPKSVDSINPTSRLNTDAISMRDLSADDGDSDVLPTVQQRLFGRHERRSTFQKISDLIWRLLLSLSLLGRPVNANDTVTRSLAATIQQLRYYSGSSVFFTRGLVLYLFWYHGAFAIFELVVLFIIALPILLMSVILNIFKTNTRTDEFSFIDSLSSSIAFEMLLGIIRGAYFAICSEHIAFHTVRVLSVSTQLTTNTATKYFDPKIFKLHRKPKQLPRLSHAFWGFIYGLATFVSNAVPYWMIYGITSTKTRTVPPNISQLLSREVLWRVLLTLCLDAPAMLIFVSSQARHIDPKEHTIVRCQQGPYIRPYYDVVTRVNWARAFRIMVQCFVVGGIALATIALLGYLQFRNLYHADEFKSWIYGNYLDTRRAHAPFVTFRTLNWWRDTVLITLNPWKSVIPYNERFIRWQVFGDES